jgi:transposase
MFHDRFISKWNNKFLTCGVSGLRLGYKGKSSYLSQSEKGEIIAWLNNKTMWDIAELAIHIYSLFKSAQVSWKKSQKKNPKGSPKLVEDKKKKLISI